MLKLFPIAGTTLLFVIIAYGVYRFMVMERRKIVDALLGQHHLSLCCHASTTPGGWTQDGWVSTCDMCGAWQYLGDDFLNPPIGFTENAAPAPRPAASEPESLTLLRDSGSSEVTSSWREDVLAEHYGVISDEQALEYRDAYRRRFPIAASWDDEGEPLAVPPPPNIGGEGNPDYAGPHYDVPHERFVPYDVIGDPIPGAAVHIVKEDRGNASFDSSRENEDKSK